MKRFFIALVVVSTLCIGVTDAQQMQKGMSLFNVGLGLAPGVGVNVSYDYGLIDAWGPGIFTVGGYVGYQNYKTWTDNLDYRANALFFTPRATYRYAINKSFEVFGTAMLGAVFYSYSKYKDGRSDVRFSTTAGCRYSFTPDISVFAEVGYNIAYLNGGLSFSF